MTLAALAALLLCVPPASARDASSAGGAFAVANGEAAFSVTTDAGAASGRVVARRLGLDGGVLWEDRFGAGRGEEAVAAAVTRYGGLTVLGNDETGCWLAHWSSRGRLDWSTTLRYGSSCQARTLLVDDKGDTYVLATTTQGDGFEATLWKFDHLGVQQWQDRPGGAVAHYAFGLTLSAAEDAVTVTRAVSGPSGWVYDSYDVDSSGRRR